jgi:hypothetical protein
MRTDYISAPTISLFKSPAIPQKINQQENVQ